MTPPAQVVSIAETLISARLLSVRALESPRGQLERMRSKRTAFTSYSSQ